MKWGLPEYILLVIQVTIIEKHVGIKLVFRRKRYSQKNYYSRHIGHICYLLFII